MNYDKAYELQKAMRESEEYKALMDAQAAVEGDSTAKGLIEQFLMQQMQWEYAKMAEAPEAEEIGKKLEELMPMIQTNSGAQAYLQAHVRWTQVSNDIYRIISEPITEGMKILEKDKQ
ncbi:YlbF family regulator [uncultured Veillonella sp.]|uniref:YlbF family regulator n=1 Tax=uncultured Veillonella sp. TaxID=159268 RepID=UPI0026603588|nr:YlbF family regulator [uncultured Veillonella sp.]